MNLVQIQYTCILVRTTQYIKVQVNISSLQLQGHRAPRRRRQRRDLRLRPRRRQHSAVSRARLLSKYRGLQCAPHATATAELVALLLTSAAQEKKGESPCLTNKPPGNWVTRSKYTCLTIGDHQHTSSFQSSDTYGVSRAFSYFAKKYVVMMAWISQSSSHIEVQNGVRFKICHAGLTKKDVIFRLIFGWHSLKEAPTRINLFVTFYSVTLKKTDSLKIIWLLAGTILPGSFIQFIQCKLRVTNSIISANN